MGIRVRQIIEMSYNKRFFYFCFLGLIMVFLPFYYLFYSYIIILHMYVHSLCSRQKYIKRWKYTVTMKCCIVMYKRTEEQYCTKLLIYIIYSKNFTKFKIPAPSTISWLLMPKDEIRRSPKLIKKYMAPNIWCHKIE